MGREMQSGTSISLTGMVENAHFNELEYRPRLSCIFALYRPETSYIESLSKNPILNLHLRPGPEVVPRLRRCSAGGWGGQDSSVLPSQLRIAERLSINDLE